MRKPILIALALAVGAALTAFSQVAPPAATPPLAPPMQQRPPAPPPYNCEPVNPNATPEARALLKTLCAVSGKGILSGQHNFPEPALSGYGPRLCRHRQVPGHLGIGLRIPGRRGQGLHHASRPDDRGGQEAGGRRLHHLPVLAHAAADGRRAWQSGRERQDERELARQRPGPSHRRAVAGADHARYSAPPALGKVHGHRGGVS